MVVFLTIIYALTVSTVSAAPLYFLNMPMNIVVCIWCGALVIGGIVGPSRAKAAIAKSQLRPYQQQAIKDVKLDKIGVLPKSTGKTVVEDHRKVYHFYIPGKGRV